MARALDCSALPIAAWILPHSTRSVLNARSIASFDCWSISLYMLTLAICWCTTHSLSSSFSTRTRCPEHATSATFLTGILIGRGPSQDPLIYTAEQKANQLPSLTSPTPTASGSAQQRRAAWQCECKTLRCPGHRWRCLEGSCEGGRLSDLLLPYLLLFRLL